MKSIVIAKISGEIIDSIKEELESNDQDFDKIYYVGKTLELGDTNFFTVEDLDLLEEISENVYFPKSYLEECIEQKLEDPIILLNSISEETNLNIVNNIIEMYSTGELTHEEVTLLTMILFYDSQIVDDEFNSKIYQKIHNSLNFKTERSSLDVKSFLAKFMKKYRECKQFLLGINKVSDYANYIHSEIYINGKEILFTQHISSNSLISKKDVLEPYSIYNPSKKNFNSQLSSNFPILKHIYMKRRSDIELYQYLNTISKQLTDHIYISGDIIGDFYTNIGNNILFLGTVYIDKSVGDEENNIDEYTPIVYCYIKEDIISVDSFSSNNVSINVEDFSKDWNFTELIPVHKITKTVNSFYGLSPVRNEDKVIIHKNINKEITSELKLSKKYKFVDSEEYYVFRNVPNFKVLLNLDDSISIPIENKGDILIDKRMSPSYLTDYKDEIISPISSPESSRSSSPVFLENDPLAVSPYMFDENDESYQRDLNVNDESSKSSKSSYNSKSRHVIPDFTNETSKDDKSINSRDLKNSVSINSSDLKNSMNSRNSKNSIGYNLIDDDDKSLDSKHSVKSILKQTNKDLDDDKSLVSQRSQRSQRSQGSKKSVSFGEDKIYESLSKESLERNSINSPSSSSTLEKLPEEQLSDTSDVSDVSEISNQSNIFREARNSIMSSNKNKLSQLEIDNLANKKAQDEIKRKQQLKRRDKRRKQNAKNKK